MNKIVIAAGIVAALVVGGVALNQNSKQTEPILVSANTSGVVSDPNSVSIQDFSYKSDKLTIKKGTTITWTNKDDARHDITPTTGSSDFVASKLLAKGETYQFTFNQLGTYTYKCSPHPYMKGTIEVTE